MKLERSASCSMGYPLYRRMPLSPSMNEMADLTADVLVYPLHVHVRCEGELQPITVLRIQAEGQCSVQHAEGNASHFAAAGQWVLTDQVGKVLVLIVGHSRVIGAEAHSITTSLDLFQGAGHDCAIFVNLHNDADVSQLSVICFHSPSLQPRNGGRQKEPRSGAPPLSRTSFPCDCQRQSDFQDPLQEQDAARLHSQCDAAPDLQQNVLFLY